MAIDRRHTHTVGGKKKSLQIPKVQAESVNRRTTQWPKTKEQKNKQRTTKHTHKTKDRLTQTPVVNSGALEVLAVPAPLVAHVVLI